jgi:hypothetical protein
VYKNTNNTEKKLLILDKAIHQFDSFLEEIQEEMENEFDVYEKVVNVRDALYQLKARIRGCDIALFDSGGLTNDIERTPSPIDFFWRGDDD